MPAQNKRLWWNELPREWADRGPVDGDVIIVHMGNHAQNVAVGKNITQTIYAMLGEPEPDDREVIEQKLGDLKKTLQASSSQLDAAIAQMADMQLKLLHGELVKTGDNETPSANTITTIGDWLLDNVPTIVEALVDLFATPAVGRVVGKAGEEAVKWVKNRLGNN
jgi:hypothetical protein